jgi:hypothetical protein
MNDTTTDTHLGPIDEVIRIDAQVNGAPMPEEYRGTQHILSEKNWLNQITRNYLDATGNHYDCRFEGLVGPYAIKADINPYHHVTLTVSSLSRPDSPAKIMTLPLEFYPIMRQRLRDMHEQPIRHATAKDDAKSVEASEVRDATLKLGVESVRLGLKSIGLETNSPKDCGFVRPLFDFMVRAYAGRINLVDSQDIIDVNSPRRFDRKDRSYSYELMQNAEIKIGGEEDHGPFRLDIEYYDDYGETALRFSKEGSAPIEVILRDSEWKEDLLTRLNWIGTYNDFRDRDTSSLNEEQRQNHAKQFRLIDERRRDHHNTLALKLKDQLATHTPPIVVDFESARNIVGVTTEIRTHDLGEDVQKPPRQWVGNIPLRPTGQRQL